MKKVIVIGGGFAGARVAKRLENDFDVILFDTKDYFEFTPGVLRTIVQPKHAKKIQVLHSHYLKKAKFENDKVIHIEGNTASTSKKKFSFDYLVITAGSSYNVPFKEKDVVISSRGVHLRNYYTELCEAKKVLIIGGGIVGVELAGEILDFYNDKEITIIQSGSKLMERCHEKSRMIAEKFLKRRNVRIIFNERATDKKGNKFRTEKGRMIESDLAFLCTGIIPNSKFLKNDFPWTLDSKGFLKVNEFLQVEGLKNIFAAGDINNVKEEKTAQAAEKQANIIVRNVINLEKNERLYKYCSKKKPMVVSLGKWNGIFECGNFVMVGIIPALMKRIIEWKTMNRYK